MHIDTTALERREKALEKLIADKEKALVKAPKGILRCSGRKEGLRYYVHNTDNKKDSYIRKDHLGLAASLAQKDYDQKVLKSASAELKSIRQFLQSTSAIKPEQVYGQLNPARRVLVQPIELPDEAYIEQWQNQPYKGKSFPEDFPVFSTIKNERVRSKSEAMIADALAGYGIPYRYEYPHEIQYGEVWYPDFTILDMRERKTLIWEHFGLMDDPDYMPNAVRKLTIYAEKGFYLGKQLIITNETKQYPLTSQKVIGIIQTYLL